MSCLLACDRIPLGIRLAPGSGRLGTEGFGPGPGSLRRLILLPWGLARHERGNIHFYAAIGLMAALSFHLFLHWQWISVCLNWGSSPILKAVSEECTHLVWVHKDHRQNLGTIPWMMPLDSLVGPTNTAPFSNPWPSRSKCVTRSLGVAPLAFGTSSATAGMRQHRAAPQIQCARVGRRPCSCWAGIGSDSVLSARTNSRRSRSYRESTREAQHPLPELPYRVGMEGNSSGT